MRSSTPCVFGRSIYENLRIGNSDQSIVSSNLPSYHCDRMLVDFVEKEDGSVILTPSTDEGHKTISTSTNEIAKYRNIPFGRAIDCPTLTQQAIDDDKHDRRRRPFVSLAVVGMVVENDDSNDGTDNLSLLCTRRPSYMRSFPGAFVFPGGNVDADDESRVCDR